ncbi:DUF5684 domain-containing protein [Niabella sp. 22666]|uniref:DUF5684 domain-containing protein n=1 Tax=Niabella sp. 22666 TaxID=3453954 RepID=UPI003F86191E
MYENSGIWQMVFLVPFLIITVIVIIALWKIYQKAGYQGWEAIVPIYNIYIFTKIIGKPGWWVIVLLIPYVNIVFGVWGLNMLSKSFGKGEGFTAGLYFFSFIFFPILGFGDAKYLGPFGDKAAFDTYGDKNRFDFEQAQQF